MHGLSSFEPCDLRKNYFIFVTSYYGQWGTCGGNLLVGFNTCFLHDKLLISSVVSRVNFSRSPFVGKRGPGKGRA